jgi:uncharacterized radical SAM protein YgiQ
MFLPTTKYEIEQLGWYQLDVILISGDTYIDSPYDGIAVIGKVLTNAGYKVGIIAQPDINSPEDITRLGGPRLFWGVSSGAVDSMVANYTALKKKKRSDDSTPGGLNNRRPDRAIIKYVNLIRQNFKNTKPVIIGGIEASLRRIAHYDYWDDCIRRSILFDSKADILVFGEGEKTILELAEKLVQGDDFRQIKGICYLSKEPKPEYIELPSFEEVREDKEKFIDMFNLFYQNNDPINAKGLFQKHGDRYLIQNPPQIYLNSKELDSTHELDFEFDSHPFYKKQGIIKALNTIKFSIISHRGCYGECNFCAISVHQGWTIRSRSEESILKEITRLTKLKDFKGYIFDIGGPTANMYANSCAVQQKKGSCKNKQCLSPERCEFMNISHLMQIQLLEKAKKIQGIKKVFIGSGIRYDLVVADDKYGKKYLHDIVENHVSGQLKLAPEHINDKVLQLMGKPDNKSLVKFKQDFDKLNRESGKKQFLTYYFIAAHPGCEEKDMIQLKNFIKTELKLNPEQVQVFTPTPSTYSSLMYYTGLDPKTKKRIFVEKDMKKKEIQKFMIV